jgi:uncharacterized membrane protein YfcA
LDLFNLVLIISASGLAGFVDSIVGGGGLILVPALFSAFPNAAPPSMLGNNKAASVWGTAFASWVYTRKVQLPLKGLLTGAICAVMGSFLGAWCVTQISASLFKAALPLVLSALLIYTLVKKGLGQKHDPKFSSSAELVRLALIGAFIGFYDGFFGPGTGSFFVFILVRWLGYDFLHASAGAKILNTASNAAALLLFATNGFIWWKLAIPLAIANIAGSLVGTRLALKKGTAFIRYFFIFIVTVLIIKTSYAFIWDQLLSNPNQ